MKARIKATREIVDVVITQRVTHTGEQVYMTNDGCLIEESRLDFNVDDTPDYWTRLEHQYAGMAMQGMLSNTSLITVLFDATKDHDELLKEVIICSHEYAHALVEKMKEERK